jgi:hypothetical protein
LYFSVHYRELIFEYFIQFVLFGSTRNINKVLRILTKLLHKNAEFFESIKVNRKYAVILFSALSVSILVKMELEVIFTICSFHYYNNFIDKIRLCQCTPSGCWGSHCPRSLVRYQVWATTSKKELGTYETF